MFLANEGQQSCWNKSDCTIKGGEKGVFASRQASLIGQNVLKFRLLYLIGSLLPCFLSANQTNFQFWFDCVFNLIFSNISVLLKLQLVTSEKGARESE